MASPGVTPTAPAQLLDDAHTAVLRAIASYAALGVLPPSRLVRALVELDAAVEAEQLIGDVRLAVASAEGRRRLELLAGAPAG